MVGTKRGARAEAGSGPVTLAARVAGDAQLSIQIVDRRYTAQKVIEGLNSGELKYAAGQICRAAQVVARYRILSVDDRLERFQLLG